MLGTLITRSQPCADYHLTLDDTVYELDDLLGSTQGFEKMYLIS